ncbi:MarR family winged helix-turn-helix transcriptional regulator [Streptomyces alkaliphilus]|uniref:MarR family winged helix-turn-helix transcriptional regulator n=1 Tax=Streptomyces alkaliphilus TaxID=1472722 RepID=UPI0011805214|nr:MarR family transcriptional regulator [Streptomyces alkaliphilus]MQS06355.1 MarR family transcriptional regulator [Streptomyces alkaliphilus]
MRDVVDGILDQWARERPDLDASPMSVIGRVSRLSRLLGRAVAEHLAEQGVETWEFDVLATLRRSGPPFTLSPGELAASAMIGGAALTHRADRLVERGLITREVDPANRRRVLITLTPEGLELVDRLVAAHLAHEERLLAALAPGERGAAADLLRRLLVSLGDTGRPND